MAAASTSASLFYWARDRGAAQEAGQGRRLLTCTTMPSAVLPPLLLPGGVCRAATALFSMVDCSVSILGFDLNSQDGCADVSVPCMGT